MAVTLRNAITTEVDIVIGPYRQEVLATLILVRDAQDKEHHSQNILFKDILSYRQIKEESLRRQVISTGIL
jgi:hypothetical protein